MLHITKAEHEVIILYEFEKNIINETGNDAKTAISRCFSE